MPSGTRFDVGRVRLLCDIYFMQVKFSTINTLARPKDVNLTMPSTRELETPHLISLCFSLLMADATQAVWIRVGQLHQSGLCSARRYARDMERTLATVDHAIL